MGIVTQRAAQVAAAAAGLTFIAAPAGEHSEWTQAQLPRFTTDMQAVERYGPPALHELLAPRRSLEPVHPSSLPPPTPAPTQGGDLGLWAAVLGGVALLAGIATIGKRYGIELPQHVSDLFKLLDGQSLLHGSIYTHHFSEQNGRVFMEVDSFGMIDVAELFEQKHAVQLFKSAAARCTPTQQLISCNYGAVLRTRFIWRLAGLWHGALPNNDDIRERFDERFRDVYSSKFRGQIKRKLGGFSDDRDVHFLIPFVEVTRETNRRGRLRERHQLGFAAISQQDLSKFSNPEWVARLRTDQPRYSPRIDLFVAASVLQSSYENEQAAKSNVQLPPDHPDFEVRRPSYFPRIRVNERTPQGKNGPSTLPRD